MSASSQAQRETLAPVVMYFDHKHRDREEKYVTDHRFIASVQELMRADGRDQVEWADRRRHRLRAGSGGEKPSPSKNGTRALPKALKTDNCHRHSRRQPSRRGVRRVADDDKNEPKANKEQALDPTQAMIRLGKLKATLSKARDPPAVAAELAMLFLVLSDQVGALKSFLLAVEPSPKWVPTKKETEKRELQKRRLMLLNKERRAEALAELEAQDKQRGREREAAEKARRRHAATGIFLCLLKLERPVQAAEAARARLGMCETNEEREKVEGEIHDALLKYDALIEPTATNQGSWLTESAGALPDLHTSVLRNLVQFYVQKGSTPTSPRNGPSAEEENTALKAKRLISDGNVRQGEGNGTLGSRRKPSRSGGGDGSSATDEADVSAGAGDSASRVAAWRAHEGDLSAATPRDGAAATTTTRVLRGRPQTGQQGDQRRARLRHLGLLLARKRQFAASKQAFEEAILGGPDELALRERYKARTPGFFLNAALQEATPDLGLSLDSRWEGGVDADEARRRALTDFCYFTGVHRGAETLVAALPPGGWAAGSGPAAEVAYAERLSRSRIRVDPLHQRWRRRQQQQGTEMVAEAAGGAMKKTAATAAASGLLLGHMVPAEDVTAPA